ncbi:MAG: anti-sigma factor antagonist [Gemmataceae bacterium]
METHLEIINNVGVLELLGEYLDESNCRDLKTQLANQVQHTPKLVLDLGRVEFVDSSGLGVIIGSLSKIRGAGGDLKLANVTPRVRTLFDLVRLQNLVDILDTRDEAVASFKQ